MRRCHSKRSSFSTQEIRTTTSVGSVLSLILQFCGVHSPSNEQVQTSLQSIFVGPSDEYIGPRCTYICPIISKHRKVATRQTLRLLLTTFIYKRQEWLSICYTNKDYILILQGFMRINNKNDKGFVSCCLGDHLCVFTVPSCRKQSDFCYTITIKMPIQDKRKGDDILSLVPASKKTKNEVVFSSREKAVIQSVSF